MRKLLLAAICAAIFSTFWLARPDGPILKDVTFGALALDSEGSILRLGLAKDDKYRLPVRLDEISPAAVAATLAYEDRYFYLHPGVNPFALLRAAASLTGGRRLGASTLTMQTARLLYGLKTNTITGKIRQIWRALLLESRFSKQEILEAYFNLAPYGGNIEGIEAASRIYFHKPASQLTNLEAEALALVPQNPIARKPGTGQKFAEARKRLSSGPALAIFSHRDLPFSAPHLALELTSTKESGRIQTTLERDLQAMLEKSIAGYVDQNSRYGIVNAAALLLSWPDMRVSALAGSADFKNNAISGQIDGTKAARSPGSTLKPFIYGLALDRGLIHPHTILPDTPRSFGGYDPENFDRGFAGPVPAHAALKASRNLPAIYLSEKIGHPGLYELLKEAGASLKFGSEHYGLSLTLGGAEITMRDLASLYAMLPNQGIWRPLRFTSEACGQPAKRLLSPEAAWLTLKMLDRPEAVFRTGRANIPYYYKTGTSNGLRDAWTCGIIGEYVLAVWIGNFDNRANPNFVGALAALPLFERIGQTLVQMRNLKFKVDLPAENLNLSRIEVCAATGDLFQNQCEAKNQTYIIPGVTALADSGIIRKIRLDKITGLRVCGESGKAAKDVWWEFWPSDLKQIFAKAGIYKPDPPAWAEGCQKSGYSPKPPRIILPKKHVTYQRRISEDNFRLPLQAAADSEAGQIHWYAGKSYLGSAQPGEIIYWNAPMGRQRLTAVDDAGRSVNQECIIAGVP